MLKSPRRPTPRDGLTVRERQAELIAARNPPEPPEPEPLLGKPQAWPGPGKMHFRLVEDRLGELNLDCNGGYVVTAYDLGSPDERAVVVNNSLDDGTFDNTRYHGARSISLDIILKPHTGPSRSSQFIGAEAKLRDRLLAYTYPGIRPRLIFSEHEDDRIKQALLRGTQASVAVDKQNYNEVNVSWVAPRGVFWSYQERCTYYMFDSTTPDIQTHTIYNAGSSPAYWRARIDGETVQPTFTLNGTEFLQLHYSSAPGDLIEIESFSKTVSVNGKPIGYTYIGDKSTWFRIPPGESKLTVTIYSGHLHAYPWALWQVANRPSFWADRAQPGNPPNNPPPVGAPPWSWSMRVNPDTGQPMILGVDFCWFDTYM